MTQRTAALAIATLLISGSFVQAAQAQDGEDRPARAGGEGPRLSPRFERPERVERAPQARPADAPVAPAIIRQAPDQGGRTAGGPATPPDTRVQGQRGGGRGGGGQGGGGRAGGGSGGNGGRAGGGGGRGGTIIIDGSRGGGGRTQGPPPRVIQGGRRGAVVVPSRIYPYGYGGFGLGYFYYDPFWNPWGPWGYGGMGAWGGPWGYGGGYGYYGGGHQDDFGKVRLDVKGPKDAQVLVDGYYAGTLDDFDGAFQGLELESGTYRIEVESEGYERLGFDTRVTDGRKITLHGALRRAEQ